MMVDLVHSLGCLVRVGACAYLSADRHVLKELLRDRPTVSESVSEWVSAPNRWSEMGERRGSVALEPSSVRREVARIDTASSATHRSINDDDHLITESLTSALEASERLAAECASLDGLLNSLAGTTSMQEWMASISCPHSLTRLMDCWIAWSRTRHIGSRSIDASKQRVGSSVT